jgi:hypothetical protein
MQTNLKRVPVAQGRQLPDLIRSGAHGSLFAQKLGRDRVTRPPSVGAVQAGNLKIADFGRKKGAFGKTSQAQMFAFVRVWPHYFTMYVVGQWGAGFGDIKKARKTACLRLFPFRTA